MRILYACIVLHSAIQHFMEFEYVLGLWTELNKTLTFTAFSTLSDFFCFLRLFTHAQKKKKIYVSSFKIFL